MFLKQLEHHIFSLFFPSITVMANKQTGNFQTTKTQIQYQFDIYKCIKHRLILNHACITSEHLNTLFPSQTWQLQTNYFQLAKDPTPILTQYYQIN